MSYKDELITQFIKDNFLSSHMTRRPLVSSFTEPNVDAAIFSLIESFNANESKEGTYNLLIHMIGIAPSMAKRGVKDSFNLMPDIYQYIETLTGPEGAVFIYQEDNFDPVKDVIYDRMYKGILENKGISTGPIYNGAESGERYEELKHIALHCPKTMLRLIKAAVQAIDEQGKEIDRIYESRKSSKERKGVDEENFKNICDSVYVLSKFIRELKKNTTSETDSEDKDISYTSEDKSSSKAIPSPVMDIDEDLYGEKNEGDKLTLGNILRPYFDPKTQKVFKTPLLRPISVVGQIMKSKVNPERAKALVQKRVKWASTSFYRLLESLLNYCENTSGDSVYSNDIKLVRNVIVFKTLDRAIKKLGCRLNLSSNEVLSTFGGLDVENDKGRALDNILMEIPIPEISVISLSIGIFNCWKLIHIKDIDLRWLLNPKLRCDLLFGNTAAMVSTKQLITKMKEFQTEKRTLLPLDNISDNNPNESKGRIQMSISTRLFIYNVSFLRLGFCCTLSEINNMILILKSISRSFAEYGLDVTKFNKDTIKSEEDMKKYGIDKDKYISLIKKKTAFEVYRKTIMAFRSLIIFTGIIDKSYKFILNCCQLFFTKDHALKENYPNYPVTDYSSRYMPSCIIKCFNGVSEYFDTDFKIMRYYSEKNAKMNKAIIFLKLVIDGSSNLDERVHPPKKIVRDASECLSTLLTQSHTRDTKKWYYIKTLSSITEYEFVDPDSEDIEEGEEEEEKQKDDHDGTEGEPNPEAMSSNDMPKKEEQKKMLQIKHEIPFKSRFPPDHFGLLVRFFSPHLNPGISLSIARGLIQSKLYSNFLSGTIGVQFKILKLMGGIFSSDNLTNWHTTLEKAFVNEKYLGTIKTISKKKLPERGTLLTDMGIKYSGIAIQMFAQYVNEYINNLEECLSDKEFISDKGETKELSEEDIFNIILSSASFGMSLTTVNLLHMIGLTSRIPQITIEIRNCMEIILVLLYSIGHLSKKTFSRCDDAERKHIYIKGKVKDVFMNEMEAIYLATPPPVESISKESMDNKTKYVTTIDKKKIEAIPVRIIIRGLLCEMLYRMYKIVEDTPNEIQFLRCVQKDERGFELFKNCVKSNDIHECSVFCGNKYLDAFLTMLDKIDHIDETDQPIVDTETINYDDYDLPEEFLDPITYTALVEPVELPFSHVIINRDSFLNSNIGREHMVDVFAPGETVTLEMLKPRPDILEKMRKWVEEEEAKRHEMSKHQTMDVDLFMDDSAGMGKIE